ncbi:UDP-N-acetylenolpyruvoylglucosamine reductase [[Clostridium] ultunense Esp]|uniref:UDP-N-acetylenolpyruvoylglucosamine reductase n=1 Tax=[Clostridium] ultunense Esp TaxID=1288971 RepID=M1ZHW0_9FIRM|nr:UDP-N-acetylmuramate dehydrogenase [Schnuerera ultunensis]CCQ97958.1 UDP-N-acetylenolpyruvoylglucosamine reductase [[Clostridium] ultunense Esp]SHD75625.1 UDP-N-acetylenolpyruvoylglucosamine reductase [[Clostridium] ultunense Esp]
MEISKLYTLFKDKSFGEILFDEPMKNHTSFKIGGPADIMVIPNTEREVIESIKFCRDNHIKYFIMGNGTNLLVKDTGIRGVVIKIANGFDNIEIDGNKVICQSGTLISVIAKEALRQSLAGFEFASGIPGTIGGAITMNAGAYGGEMKDIVTKVRVLDKNNNVVELTNGEMNFRYRGSTVIDQELVVLGVELELEEGEYSQIEEKMKDLTHRRVSKQPLDLPSGGSTFKRPTGFYAGKLIDDAGLRGIRYGDAQISEKHCGFMVNRGEATFDEVFTLIKTVQKIVYDKFNIMLEPEIKIIGDD